MLFCHFHAEYCSKDRVILSATQYLQSTIFRGSGTVPCVQCVADGEVALERAMRDALPFALFTNDFMHAACVCAIIAKLRSAA